MEAAVNSLEAMEKWRQACNSYWEKRVNKRTADGVEQEFQVAESDLDNIQSVLEYETMKGIPGELSQEENPLALIQQLSVMKSRYRTLCEWLDRISAEQQESMRSISATLNKTLRLVQKIQQHAGIETLPLSEEQQLAMQQLKCQAFQQTDALAKQKCLKEYQIH